MVTVNTIFSDSIEIKGSKFIAHLMPISVYEEEMKRLREEHPKAVHWVSASRNLNEFDQIVESAHDDGEPRGTSGKPTLSVVQGSDLIDAAIITVRYFGGTKLGPGGLVRAYADAANAAVAVAELLPYEKKFVHTIASDYKNISIVEYEMAQNAIRCLSKTFGEKGAEFTVEGSEENLEKFFAALGRSVEKKT
ncbi:MAG: YigZ family protein [Campylobacterales bacterium]|nr:YigZ family protein [Campylobacterales bacterium]